MRSAVYEEEAPSSSVTLLIYIHGFNVDRDRSMMQWSTLRSRLGIGDDFDRVESGLFLWPSDLRESRGWSRMAYPGVIRRAEEAGRLLGEYLRRRASNKFVLIGHSLGALVALAAADRLRGRSSLVGLALLGAAVRTKELEITGAYGVFPLAAREVIAFSPMDRVLQSAFRFGERLATPFEQSGQAVGLTGNPATRGWERFGSRLDHHEYWRFDGSAEVVCRALGQRVGNRFGWQVAERSEDLVP